MVKYLALVLLYHLMLDRGMNLVSKANICTFAPFYPQQPLHAAGCRVAAAKLLLICGPEAK